MNALLLPIITLLLLVVIDIGLLIIFTSITITVILITLTFTGVIICSFIIPSPLAYVRTQRAHDLQAEKESAIWFCTRTSPRPQRRRLLPPLALPLVLTEECRTSSRCAYAELSGGGNSGWKFCEREGRASVASCSWRENNPG